MGYSSTLKSIYGGSTSVSNIGSIISNTCCTDALKSLSSLFSVLESLVEIFFPSTAILNPMIADMSVIANVSDKVYVRLIWSNKNPDAYFFSSLVQRREILDIYIEEGLDYSTDPLFMDDVGLSILQSLP
jgi:hypothetical protein